MAALADNMPKYAFVFMVFMLASVGLPGTVGLHRRVPRRSSARSRSTPGSPFFATTGMILGAAYMLYLYRRVIFGTAPSDDVRAMLDLELARGRDLRADDRRRACGWGSIPSSFLRPMQPSVANLIERVQAAERAHAALTTAARGRRDDDADSSPRPISLPGSARDLPRLRGDGAAVLGVLPGRARRARDRLALGRRAGDRAGARAGALGAAWPRPHRQHVRHVRRPTASAPMPRCWCCWARPSRSSSRIAYNEHAGLARPEYPVLVLLGDRRHDDDDLGERPDLALSRARAAEPGALRAGELRSATAIARPRPGSNISSSARSPRACCSTAPRWSTASPAPPLRRAGAAVRRCRHGVGRPRHRHRLHRRGPRLQDARPCRSTCGRPTSTKARRRR